MIATVPERVHVDVIEQETNMVGGIILLAIIFGGAWVSWTLDLQGIRARHKIITGKDL